MLSVLLGLVAWVAYRYLVAYDGPKNPLTWVIPVDLAIYRMAGAEMLRGGLLYDTAYVFDLTLYLPALFQPALRAPHATVG
ncbi:hypothetical protein CUTER_06980 [Corynebacterium uterequi]|uniref:Uncharacterized protein n=2 Tax=Corynebacterium uterequi TaxID=1072256 RepID=A0A0G3HF73_9CORY|nr:hypothetical protein CUTER_06980 [Corynebacterium uterequi]